MSGRHSGVVVSSKLHFRFFERPQFYVPAELLRIKKETGTIKMRFYGKQNVFLGSVLVNFTRTCIVIAFMRCAGGVLNCFYHLYFIQLCITTVR